MTAQLTPGRIQATTTELPASTGRGPVRRAWRRIRLTAREMNYASRRVVELQAPWSVDERWHRK
jgi:hypothetical protein